MYFLQADLQKCTDKNSKFICAIRGRAYTRRRARTRAHARERTRIAVIVAVARGSLFATKKKQDKGFGIYAKWDMLYPKRQNRYPHCIPRKSESDFDSSRPVLDELKAILRAIKGVTDTLLHPVLNSKIYRRQGR